LANDLAAEANARHAAYKQLDGSMKDLLAGGLRLETTGLSWLVLGVIAGTLPLDLATWLK
jgi:hypothetical protein